MKREDSPSERPWGAYDLKRAETLDSAGADVLVIDAAHFHDKKAVRSAAYTVKRVSADIVVDNLGQRRAFSMLSARSRGSMG
ncbi:MAG: IMP dehydrogenase [Fervidicoccaceae archaeon]